MQSKQYFTKIKNYPHEKSTEPIGGEYIKTKPWSLSCDRDNRGLLRKYREYISFIQGFYGFSGLILKRIEACSLECSIYYF